MEERCPDVLGLQLLSSSHFMYVIFFLSLSYQKSIQCDIETVIGNIIDCHVHEPGLWQPHSLNLGQCELAGRLVRPVAVTVDWKGFFIAYFESIERVMERSEVDLYYCLHFLVQLRECMQCNKLY